MDHITIHTPSRLHFGLLDMNGQRGRIDGGSGWRWMTPDQIAAMQNVDVALVPTGGLPTIELDDLYRALEKIKPRITIPIHHALPGCKFLNP